MNAVPRLRTLRAMMTNTGPTKKAANPADTYMDSAPDSPVIMPTPMPRTNPITPRTAMRAMSFSFTMSLLLLGFRFS